MSTYVAKGLWRNELPYAHELLEATLRQELHKMLVWLIGVRTDFAVSPGKLGKYFERLLEPELWARWRQTCPIGSVDAHWGALDAMCSLFRTVAQEVAAHFGYTYPQEDDERVSAYLRYVRRLPHQPLA